MLKQGLLQVYTGDGKGKTTAAVGLATRARGAGLRVAFVQFIKGGPMSSELAALRDLGVEVVRPAVQSTGLLGQGIHDEDTRAAAAAWEFAAGALASGHWDVVIMDELNIALKYGLLDQSTVLDVLRARPAHVEALATGRGAPEALCELADLVTEMVMHKHPYDAGVPARRGIDS